MRAETFWEKSAMHFSLEYWFLFPVSIVIAALAMSSGVGGAIFFSPLYMIGLKLDPSMAIGTALVTEWFGFNSGIVAYTKRHLIDYKLGFSLLLFSIPASLIGSASADCFPAIVLKTIFAVGIIFIGTQLYLSYRKE